MELEIKEIDLTYYDMIIKLWTDAGLSTRPKGRDRLESLENQVKTGVVHFFGAFHNDEMAGVVLLSHDSRRGWINRIAVKSNCQGQGIATKLIKFAENYFENLGIEIYCALIEGDNVNSINLFLKNHYILHDDIIYFTKRKSKES